MARHDELFFVALLGDAGVGKTALVRCVTGCPLPAAHEYTRGNEQTPLFVRVDEKQVKLWLRDLGGLARFSERNQAYLRSCLAILIVYDTTSRASFDRVPFWLDKSRDECRSEFYAVLVGTKADLAEQRQVATAAGHQFARDNGMVFVETSAKDYDAVERMFHEVARHLLTLRTKKGCSVM
jgi:small GTP-binding protein